MAPNTTELPIQDPLGPQHIKLKREKGFLTSSLVFAISKEEEKITYAAAAYGEEDCLRNLGQVYCSNAW